MLRRDRGRRGVKLITSTVTLSRTARSTPCVEGAGKSMPRSVGVPRDTWSSGRTLRCLRNPFVMNEVEA